jgi:hypothetical protein
MQLANQEAQRFQQFYIGTEHILLGLVKEGSGVAVNALKSLGVDPDRIAVEIDRLFRKDPPAGLVNKLPTTPRAKMVVNYAMEEARNLKHSYVGTEHILLGLLREEEGVAAQVLMKFGLALDKVRGEIRAILQMSPENAETNENASQSPVDRVNDLPAKPDKPSEACPKCGDPNIARVLWNRVHLSAQDQEDIYFGKAILAYYSKVRKKPAWVCLRCSPEWPEVHRLAMLHREWQLAKETAVASEDFETAIKHRDAQRSLRQQLMNIVEELL